MRVTNNTMVSTLLRDLNTNMERMNQSQEQLSSSKRINRPSDDPVGVVGALRLRTDLLELDQYKSNAEDAKSWLDASDSALNEAGNVMQRIRELTVQGASDTLPQISRDAIAQEISDLRSQLLQISNSTYGGRYLFSGSLTQTAAFNGAGVFSGNASNINYEVGVGAQIPINIDGNTAFGTIFTDLNNLVADLNAGNTANVRNLRIGQIDAAMDQQLTVRSDLGARSNRIDLAVNRMDAEKVNMTNLLSKTEDVDMAELITKLKMQENVYNASLSAGAKIVQPSLIDFLR